MGFLTAVTQSLVRGADRMSKWTSKRGPSTFTKSRGAKKTGIHTSDRKFVQIKEMVPEFVVPDLTGFKLNPYNGTRSPELWLNLLLVLAPFWCSRPGSLEKDFKEGTFDADNLEIYGFEPTQEGKLFQLYPKNFPR
uniref:39S ribosomal protein L41, mitochondrial n=1 Tax=Mus spicilegus TaxID=10103 RepID=A0A8C6IDF0_MUSSI